MNQEGYDTLQDLDWIQLYNYSFLVKYKFHEDGYTLAVTDLTAVYGEILNLQDIQERFQSLNPCAEILPNVLIKHLKLLAKNSLTHEQSHEQTQLMIVLIKNKFLIQNEFEAVGDTFMYIFKPQMLPHEELRTLIAQPTLLKMSILFEEKTALLTKVKELEGALNSSSCGSDARVSNKRREIQDIISNIRKKDNLGFHLIHAFLYLQNDNLPECLESTPSVSNMNLHIQNVQSSECPLISVKEEKNEDQTNLEIMPIQLESDESTSVTILIKEEENESDESNLRIPFITNIKKTEDEINENDFDYLSAKGQNPRNHCASRTKRQVAMKNNDEKYTSYTERQLAMMNNAKKNASDTKRQQAMKNNAKKNASDTKRQRARKNNAKKNASDTKRQRARKNNAKKNASDTKRQRARKNNAKKNASHTKRQRAMKNNAEKYTSYTERQLAMMNNKVKNICICEMKPSLPIKKELF